MILRAARAGERAALEDLQRRASLANESDRAALLAHPDAIDLPAAHVAHTLVAAADGAALGFAVVLPQGATSALDGLFVDPPALRRGIGAALVAAAAVRARDSGAAALTVVAGPATEAFYLRCGFVAGDPVPTRFGPARAMSLPLLVLQPETQP